MPSHCQIVTLLVFLSSFRLGLCGKITHHEKAAIGEWSNAHATFYGDMSGRTTVGGACGYGDLFKQGYGLATAALSAALFDNGLTCGACFEIVCAHDPRWCIKNAGSIIITATNFCPSTKDNKDPWCNPPLKHFDLSMPMFTRLAYYKAGIIPVRYRRVPCIKRGGVKFEINGKLGWTMVLVYNVGGAGNVVDVKVEGSRTGWRQMTRNWGQNWQTTTSLVGQSLSFQVKTSDGKMLQFYDVAPANWQLGQTFDGKRNF